jgi:hypothetical protein
MVDISLFTYLQQIIFKLEMLKFMKVLEDVQRVKEGHLAMELRGLQGVIFAHLAHSRKRMEHLCVLYAM